jgi:glycosyltransferase involved in cell wall biosynthesis
VIEAHGFDAVVLHNPWAFAVFAPAASGATRAVAIVLHGAVERLGWIERWSRRSRPDLVLANSRFTASTAGRLFPSLPARLWYYPIEEPPQSPDPIARAAVRAELGARENTTVIVQVSRMEPWKGHALHLDALSRLPRDLDWTCWQVGGAQRAEERAYAAAMQASSVRLGIADRVRWLGARTDVPRLLRAADLHCQPNTGPEPFGITFIEALYARLPVVTTAMGGALDIVDETVGLLVPPAAPDALAQALRSLIEDPRTRHRLGAAGPARARSICDVGTQLEALRDALAETIAATTARTRRRNGS